MNIFKIIRVLWVGWLFIAVIYPNLAFAYGQSFLNPYQNPYQQPTDFGSLAIEVIVSAITGGALGAFFSYRLRKFRGVFFKVLAAIFLLGLSVYFDTIRLVIIFFIAFGAALYLLRNTNIRPPKTYKPTTFGSAEWATLEHLKQHGIIENNGLFLGDFKQSLTDSHSLTYAGDRHLLTIAPTRSGKGVSAIIPNLLTYQGSTLVIDPKGENARITARQRGTAGLGQTVHIVDPWGITGETVSCFNPLDWLSANDEDVNENAMMLADSIVTQHQSSSDPFWNEEAKALLMGIILYVALDSNESGQRTLGRVRDIIVSDSETFKNILIRMGGHPNLIISSTAMRTASKSETLKGSVLASLQSHTHFLDSPRIRANLSRSDFKFEDLKSSKMTVYLVLPADRLETFGRWLRLIVQQAITVNARNIQKKPDKPILFLLDEMPALGRLTMVEQAYGLMAGFGMQLWGIVQVLSQLERIYDKGWETFIGNSGVLQYFGSRDQKTAEYFSKLCGVTTVEKFSFSTAISKGINFVSSLASNSSSSTSNGTANTYSETYSTDVVQRHLAYADELMVMREGKQIVIVESLNPIQGKKTEWFNDKRFKNLGNNLKNNP